MDTEKRMLLAIVLSLAVLLLYQWLFSPPPAYRPSVPDGKEPAPVIAQQPERPRDTAVITPSPQPVPELQPNATAAAHSPEDGNVTIDTQHYTAVFTAATGRIRSFTLHSYKEKIADPPIVTAIRKRIGKNAAVSDPLVNAPKELVYASGDAQLPLRTSFVGPDGRDTVFSQPGAASTDAISLTGPGQTGSLSLQIPGESALSARKQFYFSGGDYAIQCECTLSNTGDSARQGTFVVEWAAPAPEKSGGGFLRGMPTNSHNFSYHINGSVEKKDLSKLDEDMLLEGDILWTAFEEKYFTAVVIPTDPKPRQVRLRRAEDGTVRYQLLYPSVVLAPGQTQRYMCALYLGPKDMDILKHQGHHLEKTVDFGWFDIISKPLLLTLKFFYRFLGNYGLAIILLTVIIKIIFWPLTHKSFQSMKGMQQIQPEIARLKEKYGDNKEEFARQQMNLYKKYKVNPLGGCLPMLLQIPVFIALYRGLMDSIELRHADFIPFWINDLSAKDPTYVAPIVMGLSMLAQQKMTPTAADPAQARMMMFMPIIFTVMFLNFPSGLVIYWLVNNVISVAQQVYTNRKTHVAGGTECSQSKSKQKPSKKLLK